jgi:cytochrome c oxidase subunit I+III
MDAWRALRRPERPVGNPWNASTLEWLPSEDYGNRSIPRIDSVDPLWDRPELVREVEEGRHYLPRTATGARETIATSPLAAAPRYVLILPGDSWLPLIAAAGTAAFFLLLTVKLYVLAWICGIAAVAAVLGWMWESDRTSTVAEVDIGHGASIPVGATGTASHAWWAAIVMLVVDLSIFACFAFAYVHVTMRLTVCPPPGATLPSQDVALASAGLLVLGSLLVWFATLAVGTRRLPWLVLAALGCVLASCALDVRGLFDAGLDPTATAWAAAVAALASYQGLHVATLAVLAPYLAARAWCGLLGERSRASLDTIALVWHMTTLQGIAGMLVVRLVPLVMA